MPDRRTPIALAAVTVLLILVFAAYFASRGPSRPVIFDELVVRDAGRVLRVLSREGGDAAALDALQAQLVDPVALPEAPESAALFPVDVNGRLNWRYRTDGYFYQLDYSLSRVYQVSDSAAVEAILFGESLPPTGQPSSTVDRDAESDKKLGDALDRSSRR